MADIDLKPTEEMAANAARGLELREKHGRGGTAVGVARARDISNRKNLSPDTVRRMNSYFARHAVDKEGEGWGKDSAGYIAWLLWGGDAGRAWAKRKSKELENKQENAMSEIGKQIAARLGVVAKFGAKAESKYLVVLESKATQKNIKFRTMATSESDARLQATAAYGDNWEVIAVVHENSRPGAKAKFADEGFAVTDAEYEVLAANAANQKRLTALGSMADYVITANDRSIRERAKAALAAAKARNDAWHKMWEQASTASAKAEVERRAEESERGMKRWKQISRSGFSRPGAKSTNAADILKVEVMDGSTVTSSMTPSDFMAYAKRSLPGIGSTSSLPDMIARFNELAEEKGMRVRVRSNLAKSNNAIREGEKVSAGTNFKNAQDEMEWIASAIEYAYDTITDGNSENDRKTLARIDLLKKRAKQLSLELKRRGEL